MAHHRAAARDPSGPGGLYLGLVFAPNHKGMTILDADTPMDALRAQVVTARNVRGNPITDWWYGGLNYQIEHHLFPSLSRNRLGAVQRMPSHARERLGVVLFGEFAVQLATQDDDQR